MVNKCEKCYLCPCLHYAVLKLFKKAFADRTSFGTRKQTRIASDLTWCKILFKHTSSKTVALLIEWILTGTESFIPQKRFQQKPISQTLLTTECAAAKAYRNCHYNIYRCVLWHVLHSKLYAIATRMFYKMKSVVMPARSWLCSWKIFNTFLNRRKA